MTDPDNSTARERISPSAAPGGIDLPVLPSQGRSVRTSRMSRWRATSLVAVHLLMIAHVSHWLLTGRTLSPIEPSEAMYTLNDGHVNAGFIFFVLALVATLIAGRFVCGWGCHLIAYQDLCTWLLKKWRIKPKPLRSRVLVLAPLALAIYMFVWPSLYRWWADLPTPTWSNHLIKTDFWETFPGPVIAVATILICGFGIVYFLGAKGFCTYACPYGGFFALADKVAPGRIVVSDACEHCGHCTATCSSNVRVHEEVARYGMVVDPGCMKCMDCVSVCPNDALSFGFTTPSIAAGPRAGYSPPVDSTASKTHRSTPYDFALWEELTMILVGVAVLLSLRGLYGQLPLLLSMALAAVMAFLFAKVLRMARSANVRLQSLQLKRGGRLTRSGIVFALVVGALFLLTGHSAVIRYSAWRGQAIVRSLAIDDTVWFPGHTWWSDASVEQRRQFTAATNHLERMDRWGLAATRPALADLVWLYLAQDRDADAEALLRRLIALAPEHAEYHRGLAGILRKTNRFTDADRSYRRAIELDPALHRANRDLAAMHYDRGMALLQQRRIGDAMVHLQAAATTRPEVAIYHYNLGVATFMSGRPADALPHIRQAIQLDPDDPDAPAFLAVVQAELDR